jgi:hypothetical protein
VAEQEGTEERARRMAEEWAARVGFAMREVFLSNPDMRSPATLWVLASKVLADEVECLMVEGERLKAQIDTLVPLTIDHVGETGVSEGACEVAVRLLAAIPSIRAGTEAQVNRLTEGVISERTARKKAESERGRLFDALEAYAPNHPLVLAALLTKDGPFSRAKMEAALSEEPAPGGDEAPPLDPLSYARIAASAPVSRCVRVSMTLATDAHGKWYCNTHREPWPCRAQLGEPAPGKGEKG